MLIDVPSFQPTPTTASDLRETDDSMRTAVTQVANDVVWGEPGCPQSGRSASVLGQVVGERYELLELIGRGGAGRVYRALDRSCGEEVALKLVSENLTGSDVLVARARREAQMLIGLRHRNIVCVRDDGESEFGPFMVMDLLQGESLASLLARRWDGLTEPFVLQLVRALMGGLAHAHSHGLVHRDIKPGNLVLCDRKDPSSLVLVDFGIAKRVTEPGRRLTAPGWTGGTPAYMSPEQCRGKAITSAADVYSAGVVLFELLTGSLPFSATSRPEMMANHLYASPPFMFEMGARVPQKLEWAVRKALSKSAAERPSAREFADLLQGLCRQPTGALVGFCEC